MRTVDIPIETQRFIQDEDELREAIAEALPPVTAGARGESLKERVWREFLEHYDVIAAVYDEPDDGDSNEPDEQED
jgi:hypothetical protein